MTTTLNQSNLTETQTYAEQRSGFTRAVEQLDVRKHSKAPLRLEGEFLFAASPQDLFSKITDPKAIAGWFGMVKGGHMDHSMSCKPGEWGGGSKRFCQSTMGTLEETIYSHEAPYVSAYNVKTWSMPMEDHCSVMMVEPLPNGGARLTWRHYFNDKTILLSRIMPKMLAAIINTGMRNLANEMGGKGGAMLVLPASKPVESRPSMTPTEAHA